MTPKQEAFVREYLIDLNATQAAMRAGYSAKTANEQGARLLANVSVRSAIEQAKARRAEESSISAKYVLDSIQRVAETAERENKFSDAIRGFELLGKHLGIFVEKREITGKDGKDLTPGSPVINLTLNK
jgi:phage terminase small subunit